MNGEVVVLLIYRFHMKRNPYSIPFYLIFFPHDAVYCDDNVDPHDWLSASLSRNSNPLLLQRLFGVLHRALFHNDTDTRGAAALALKHLCDATAGHLAQFMEPLMQLYTTALNAVIGAKNTSDAATSAGTEDGGMEAEDVLQIIEGVGYVVSALPVEQADPVLSAMLHPIATPLLQIFPEGTEGAAPETNVIVLHFDRLAAVMRYVAHPELVATVFRELWPLVARGLERCGDRDERSAEHICRCIKYTFRTARWGDACVTLHISYFCLLSSSAGAKTSLINRVLQTQRKTCSSSRVAPYYMIPPHRSCGSCRCSVHKDVCSTSAREPFVCRK